MNDVVVNRSRTKTVGWVLSGLLTAFMLFSAVGKFTTFEGKAEMFAKVGWSESVMMNIGDLPTASTTCHAINLQLDSQTT
jgi:hypothetical protein